MALFGDLEHHALPDLVRVLRTQSGTLFCHSAYRGRTLELTLVRGHLHALYLDGFPVRDAAQVRDILRELRAQGRGAFEFKPRDFSASLPGFYDLPLTELVAEFAEAPVLDDQLPHPDTRFVPAAQALPVPASLTDPWTLLQPHLLSGASASELAARVGRPERDVLMTLHRLRAVGLITPQRAAQPRAATVSGQGAGVVAAVEGAVPTVPPPAPAPLLGRLLGALRRLTGVTTA